MTGTLLLIALVLALVAALEVRNRRQTGVLSAGSRWQGAEDRDAGRARLDLLALAGRAEPFAHKPFAPARRTPGREPRHAASPVH